ncbi:MAG: hypothetical protein CL916_07755 [Deltaproteobacteria bacterium]|nr:hypothetical protein [Deltaproteobacteria bacterium]
MHFFFLLFLSCEDSSNAREYEKKSKPTKALLVGQTLVKKGDVAKYLELTGTIEGITQAAIIPPSTGTLVDLYVQEGSSVHKDQPLAQLQNHNIEASAQRASLDYQKSRAEFARIESLYKKGAIAEREYRESRSALDIAQIGNREAQKTKAQNTIKSPISGTVTTISAREGEVVGSAPLLTIIDLHKLRLTAMVPEKELSYIKLGQAATIISAYDEKMTSKGKIEYISPVVESTSGSIKIFIDLEENQNTLRAGQFVRARIKVDERIDTPTIPKEALLYRDGQAIVYTYTEKPDEEGKEEDIDQEKHSYDLVAKAVDVQVGYSDEKQVEILNGVVLGDPIITIGNTALKDGSLILLEEPTEKKNPSKEGE